MTDESPALDTLSERLLGVPLAMLRRLPARSLCDALTLVARHQGPACALTLLDAARPDGETVDVTDTRVNLLLDDVRYDDAIRVAYERLTREESAQGQAILIRALLNGGRVAEAAALTAAMREVDPETITTLYVSGLVALAEHRPDAAAELFNRLRELYGDTPQALRGLARLAYGEGDPRLAVDLAVHALEHDSPPDALREMKRYAQALALVVPNDPTAIEALKHGERITAAHDSSVRARLAKDIEKIQEKSGDDDDATATEDARRRGIDDAGKAIDDNLVDGWLCHAPVSDPSMLAQARQVLREVFGYEAFWPGQEEVIGSVTGGSDTLAIMPPGAGKSLCYQVSALVRPGVTLVVSPLMAHMKELVDALPPTLLARTTLLDSALETGEQELRLREIGAGRYRLVYAAPERLRQRPFIHALVRGSVSLVVIDEAHCLSVRGSDFRPDYLFIRTALADMGGPRVLAVTAAATRRMAAEIARALDRRFALVTTAVLRDNLYLIAQEAETDDHKLRLLLPFMRHRRGPGIVYVSSPEVAERLERELRADGVNARAYHGGLGAAERTTLQERFISGEIRVMVATTAFGMGVNKADIRFIVHYNPPLSLEAYSQEAGRAGRDGKPAVCLLVHTRGDRAAMETWAREETISLDGVRAIYRTVRGLVGAASACLLDESSLRERIVALGYPDTDLRVALSLLENAGLLRRGPDVPRGATVAIQGDDDATEPVWSAFLEGIRDERRRAGARPFPMDLVHTARSLGIDAATLEDRLLVWQDEERLTYHGVGRDMWIELVPPPADAAARMQEQLDAIRRRNEERLRSVFAYLDTATCRHRFISHYVGQAAPAECRRCDLCRRVRVQEPVPAEVR